MLVYAQAGLCYTDGCATAQSSPEDPFMVINNRSLLITALIAGLAMGVLSSLPIINLLNCLLCAWLWLGGIFAVWYYRRENPGSITLGQGALIGAAAGLAGALVGTILTWLIGGAGLAQALINQREMLGEAGEMIFPVVAGGLGMIFSLLFNLIFYPLFGAIGGLIGASIFGRPSYGQPGQPGPYAG
jgi:hypothetical protein